MLESNRFTSIPQIHNTHRLSKYWVEKRNAITKSKAQLEWNELDPGSLTFDECAANLLLGHRLVRSGQVVFAEWMVCGWFGLGG